jgi:carbonic anhydrase
MANHNDSISQLIDGHHSFKEKHTKDRALYEKLAKQGQKPPIMMIACCDSRVDPTVIFNCQPGELFVVRNVANLVPPFENDTKHHGTSAALEFAVMGLNVKDIVLLGHSQCGGIQSLMNAEKQDSSTDFISTWMNVAAPAKHAVLANSTSMTTQKRACHCEREALLVSLKNLKSFPWIQSRVNTNELHLHAWHFDLATGEIHAHDKGSNTFTLLK